MSICWLRDESLEEFDNLPMFDEDLEAALEQFRELACRSHGCEKE